MSDPHNLQRFVDAQEEDFNIALDELRAGSKRNHWIWYIFPQLEGLGRSSTAKFYGIGSLDEARAYLDHPILGPALRQCLGAISQWADRKTPEQILGAIAERGGPKSDRRYLGAVRGQAGDGAGRHRRGREARGKVRAALYGPQAEGQSAPRREPRRVGRDMK